MIAVLSDIHGNYVALHRCVEYALKKNISTFIFLGDYVGDLAFPQKTMEYLYRLRQEYNCYFIRGNKEDYWLNYRRNGECGWKEYDSITGTLLYVYNNLTDKDLAFFESMLYTREISIDRMLPFTVCHGSPEKVRESLFPDNERTFEVMERDKNDLILCGHTHIRAEILHNGKLVLNPGSVGVPFKSEGKTQFLVLHEKGKGWEHEFVSLDYDVERVIAELHESGLDRKAPCWSVVTESLLRKGKVSHGDVLTRAIKLCEQETGQCRWPEVPEKYMEQAVTELL